MTHPIRLLALLALSGCTFLEYTDSATPSLTILSPEDGGYGETGASVLLSAEVSDGDDALVKLAVSISSDLDGELCVRVPGTTGLVECEATLSEGVHTLTFLATDYAEKTDEQSIVFAVGDVVIGDGDGDGYTTADGDCDDDDAGVYPGADEHCDGVDNDCDDEIDEDAIDPSTFYGDADGDGYGDAGDTAEACEAPSGYTDDGTDCDDTDASVYPEAPELFDGIDNDCDDEVDEGTDTDDDGDGLTEQDGDCDDADASVYPGADEHCNGTDDDCDGDIDEDAIDPSTFYGDADGDGFGDVLFVVVDCDPGSGFVTNAADCDDTNPDSYPGADELCDGQDNDCDEQIDDGLLEVYYDDLDGDGYGDASSSTEACEQPSSTVLDDTDCDDTDPDAFPGNTEVTDGADNDCDGDIDELDGAWSGTISVTVTGSDKGTCSDAFDVTVDTAGKVVISGSGECAAGLFEGITITGDFTLSPDAVGTLEATLAGKVATTTAWDGAFAGDDFTASFSGTEKQGKDSWSYSGDIDVSR